MNERYSQHFRSQILSLLLSLSALSLSSCSPKSQSVPRANAELNQPSDVSKAQEVVSEPSALLLKQLQTQGEISVIATLKDQQVLKLIKEASRAHLSKAGIVIAQDYSHLPILRFRIKTPSELAVLMAMPQLSNLVLDEKIKHFASQTLPLIRQPETLAKGYDGAGTSVAVLDTGVDYIAPEFGACTGPGFPANSCKVAFAKDFAPEDNQADDSVRHGTNVAALISQIAPGTKILALDVFDGDYATIGTIVDAINWVIANKETYKIVAMNLSLGAGSFTRTCAENPMSIAIQLARNAGVLAAVAAGNDANRSALAAPACSPAAVSVGAVYDRNYGALAWGSCIDLRTGADRPVCFSNSASFLSVLAPGVGVTAGGVTLSGTSQATPHVAAALAVLSSEFPSLSPDAIVDRLLSKGKPVVDPRNNITKPRIDLFAATEKSCAIALAPSKLTLGQASSSQTIILQTGQDCRWKLGTLPNWISTTSPSSGFGNASIQLRVESLADGQRQANITFTGDASAQLPINQFGGTTILNAVMTINNGASSTRQSSVSIGINAANPELLAEMCLSESNQCSQFENFAASKNFILSQGDGPKTISLWLKDIFGQSRIVTQGNIRLDTQAPSPVQLTLNRGAAYARTNQLDISINSQDPSGIKEMCLSVSGVCQSWQPYRAQSTLLIELVQGSLTVSVWLGDELGNRSPAATTASILVDSIAPVQRLFSGAALPQSFALSWSTAVDSGSGLDTYKLVYLKGDQAPAETCSNGTNVVISGANPILLTGLAARTNYSLRLCAIDKAGNISTGLVWKGKTR